MCTAELKHNNEEDYILVDWISSVDISERRAQFAYFQRGGAIIPSIEICLAINLSYFNRNRVSSCVDVAGTSGLAEAHE